MKIRLIVHTLIFNDKREILIAKRSDSDSVLPGYWDIPGGTLGFGEDPAIGAMREVLEESGLKITSPNLFAYTSNVDSAKDTQFVRLIFIAQSPKDPVVKLNPEEHSEYSWVKTDRADSYKLVDYLPQIFKALGAKDHNVIIF